jgi:4-hydroxy-tetrahydrodipicolinate reductase
MERIKLLISGMPGNMAVNVARHAMADDRFEVLPEALTGPEIAEETCMVDATAFRLVRPGERDAFIDRIKAAHGAVMAVDYTHPSAVNENAAFFCRHALPFVMGTTGGDRAGLAETVAASPVAAVIAPNMAKQIVGFQAMMEYAADTFPGLFQGYRLEVHESHQRGKADTSGTAKAMVTSFNRLGVDFKVADIHMERDPEKQQKVLGVPEVYLTGHGWHTYRLTSEDGSVLFEFRHNVNGRDVYARGTLDAAAFLAERVAEGARSRVYSMIDVLRGGV